MVSQINPPRGMRDFLPADKARRERALATIREVYARHGFHEIETPVVEDVARLHSGLGGDNEKLSYSVLKRGLTGEDFAKAAAGGDVLELADLGLRFDLTVPLARFYATHRAELPTPFRSIQVAPVWRAERPQKGRYRQFVQCDIDIIGDDTILAEVELILATVDTLGSLGLSGTSIRINDRRILTGLLDHFGYAPEEHEGVLITLDKLDKIGVDGVIAELESRLATQTAVELTRAWLAQPEVGDIEPFGESAILAQLPPGFSSEAVADLVAIGEAVAAAGETGPELVFDPLLVRGMGYYTGTIFEIAHRDFGFSLGGGGRYDGMIGRFLGEHVPAAGFSIGFERIVDLVDLPAADGADAVALLHDKGCSPAELAVLKSALVAAGRRVELRVRAKNMKRQLDELAELGVASFATVDAGATDAASLAFRPIG